MRRKINGGIVCILLLLSLISSTICSGTLENTENVSNIDVPMPFFVTPSEGEMVYDEVRLWAGESSNTDVVLTEFYYSLDGEYWTLICQDFDGTEIPMANPVDCDSPIGYGWSCYWDVSDFDEYWYYLSVRMWNAMEQYGETVIQVYVDPTPPVPSFISPRFDEIVNGDVLLSLDADDENVDFVLYEVKKGKKVFWRDVEFKDQHDYLKDFNGKNLSEVACAVVAAAACLRYWNDHGYPDILKDPDTGKPITQKQLVEELAKWAGTDEDGTTPSKLIEALKVILLFRGYWPDKLVVHSISGSILSDVNTGKVIEGDANFKRYKKELEAKKEDVLWGYNWYERNETTKKFEKAGGHCMVGTGVNNTPAEDKIGKYHNVTFMDPWTGSNLTVRMRNNGSFKDPTSGGWCHPAEMITVSEKDKPAQMLIDDEWETIAMVYDPTGGWPATWDTTSISNGVYFLRATMVDHDGFQGDDIIVVHVANQVENRAPNKPNLPSGPPSGKINVEHTYTASTIDLDGDRISYLFDWDDGSDSGWTDPIPSGETVYETHTWTEQGNYQVRVKARDTPGFEESEWSEPLSVSMPRSKQSTFFMRFLEKVIDCFPVLAQLLNLQ